MSDILWEHSFRILNNVLIGKIDNVHNEGPDIGELILEAFKSRPEFVGQVDAITGKENTFQQMRERSVTCALWLKNQGIKPGDIITICTNNQLDAYVPFLASLYIGVIANPWSEHTVKSGMEHFLNQCMPKIVFINSDKAEVLNEIITEAKLTTKIVVFGEADGFESLESILKSDFSEEEINGFSCTSRNRKDTAIVLFTSGTTGLPKGAEIPYTAFTVSNNREILNTLQPNDINLWFGSLCWITSVQLTIQSILSYITAVKFSGFEKDMVCQTIEKYKVNLVLFETSMCNQLVKFNILEKYDLSSIKAFLFGGSMIRQEVHESLAKSLPDSLIIQVYGITEIGGLCAYQQNVSKPRSSGYVTANIRLIFVDYNTGERLGPGVTGEIWCKCASLMNSYYNNPEATKDAIDSNGWFHTGDVGYYDEDGCIFIVDRIKQLIKYRGFHVSPVEIEILLQNHPSVLDVAVVPVPHDLDQEHPMAFVKKLPGAEVTEEQLKQLVADNLEDCKQLRAGVVFVEEMPRVPNGKIDRKQLCLMAKTNVNKQSS